jgi:PRC-barrel domain protein
MKVRYLLMTGSLLLAMVLSACGPGLPSGTPFSTEPAFGTETAMPGSKTPEGTTAPTETPGGTTTPGPVPVTGGKSPALLSVMMSMCVLDKDGNQLGTANDLIIDLDSLRVAFVVVDTGEKQVAVPYNMLEVSTTPAGAGCEFSFTLKADVQAFQNAKEVDLSSLPPIGIPADPNWQGKFLEFWNNTGGTTGTSTPAATGTVAVTETPAATGMASTTGTPAATGTPVAGTSTPSTGGMEGDKLHGVTLASTLLGMSFTIQDQPDLQITIEDAVVDTKSGNLLYLVIHTNLNNAEVCIPVPFSVLTVDVNSMTLVLNIDADTLQQAPTFADCQFPDMSASSWDADITTFWQSHGTNP